MGMLLLVLLLGQDPVDDEIREVMRRLDGGSLEIAEAAERLEGLGSSAAPALASRLRAELDRSGWAAVPALAQALSRLDPRAARGVLSEAFARPERPVEERLTVAALLLDAGDDESWVDDAARLARDRSLSPTSRVRAAALLERSGSTEGRSALWEVLSDEAAQPEARMQAAESLPVSSLLERARDVLGALGQIRRDAPALASRADAVERALRSGKAPESLKRGRLMSGDEPREIVDRNAAAPPSDPPGAAPAVPSTAASGSARTVNLLLAALSAVALAIALALRLRPR